jgi:acyl-CoA synthetase (AMP-forming)/AMP-acid ligase II
VIAARVLDRLDSLPPDRPALFETAGRRIGAGALSARIRAVAAGLATAGLRPGDRVLFAVRPSIDAVTLLLACVHAGGAVVAADTGMGDALFASRMALVQPRWVLAESLALGLTAWEWPRRLARRVGIALPPLARVPGARPLRAGPPVPGFPAPDVFRLPGGAGPTPPAPADPRAEAFLVFTSGTTDRPRVVVHSHRSLLATLDVLTPALAMRPDDVPYTADLHLILPALLAGACPVIPRRRPAPARLLDDLTRFRATHVFGTPADFQGLLHAALTAQRRLPESLRLVLLGSAPVGGAFLERFRAVVPAGTEVRAVYGLTEMLPVASATLEEKLAFAAGDLPGDLAGSLARGATARIAPDGELLLRGPHLCAGYLGQPPLAELPTGDLATLDPAGRIVLLGRKKAMIIRRDKNIYPGVYEPVVDRIPGVARSALVGVYDERIADERVALVVEPARGQPAADLERRVRRALRDGPHRIDADAQPDVVVVAPLPTSGRSGKVDAGAVRALVRRRLALPAPPAADSA